MTRRDFLSTAAAALPVQAQSNASPRPNIILLLSDDMGWQQVGFTGGKEVATPHIDSIAREGVTLHQFYVQPVCSPTRSCLMTGRYAWKTGMERRPTGNAAQGMKKDERTIAQALADAGYATWMIGKWHLGEWYKEHLPLGRGFQHHYGHYGAAIDSFTHTRSGVLDWHRNGRPVVEEGYSTFLFAQEAERLIANHDGAKPFFLYMPFNAVHGPHMAPPEVLKKYAHLGRYAAQRAQMECLDIAIGRVLAALKKNGLDENTLVMFTNDNGGPRIANGNGKYTGGKSAYHEGGMRVPAALRWPGKIKPGTSTNEMLHAIDLFPTFCGLAGADAKKGLPLDGQDAWKTISAGAKSPRNEIAHCLTVLRQGDHKLIDKGSTYYNWPEQPLQLYNISKDPEEKNNIAGTEPKLVAQLRDRLKWYKQFAREEETPHPIPGFPVVVYGEEENRLYGESIREQVARAVKREQSEGAEGPAPKKKKKR